MVSGDDFIRGLITRSEDFCTLIEYDASNNPIFVGDTAVGRVSAVDDKVWRIKKIDYDISNNALKISYANGSSKFDNMWTNRTIYNYS